MKNKHSKKILKFTMIFLTAIFVFIGMSSLIFKFNKNDAPISTTSNLPLDTTPGLPDGNYSNPKIPEVLGTPHQVQIGDVTINVSLAMTQTDQEIGLAKFSSLLENEGMLFIFQKPDTYSFWMKDMKFPIDIIWISEDLKIVYIEKSLSPDTYPQGYAPKDKAIYVLEVNAGFSDKHKIITGESVKFL